MAHTCGSFAGILARIADLPPLTMRELRRLADSADGESSPAAVAAEAEETAGVCE